jgi:hypothetical protein
MQAILSPRRKPQARPRLATIRSIETPANPVDWRGVRRVESLARRSPIQIEMYLGKSMLFGRGSIDQPLFLVARETKRDTRRTHSLSPRWPRFHRSSSKPLPQRKALRNSGQGQNRTARYEDFQSSYRSETMGHYRRPLVSIQALTAVD